MLVHPESPAAVIALADVVGSTTQLIDAVRTLPNPEFIVATDNGIFHKMHAAAPGKLLLEAPTAGEGATCTSCAHCPWMAMNGLRNLAARAGERRQRNPYRGIHPRQGTPVDPENAGFRRGRKIRPDPARRLRHTAMAGASLLALLDDIATILDDVSVMTKVAAKKTAGVLGDDLALNAQQVAGVKADRELPVVWAVAKGSFVNKAILVPAALAISALAPWAVTPLLMLGGAFLCYEGFEKLAHKYPARADRRQRAPRRTASMRWPTRRSIWWRWNATRSRARSAPISSSPPKSSSSRSAPWPPRRSAARSPC